MAHRFGHRYPSRAHGLFVGSVVGPEGFLVACAVVTVVTYLALHLYLAVVVATLNTASFGSSPHLSHDEMVGRRDRLSRDCWAVMLLALAVLAISAVCILGKGSTPLS